MVVLISFASATTALAVSWWSQKPLSPIFASSSFRLAWRVGTSKRVPDGHHPGPKVFNGMGQVFVNHARVLPKSWVILGMRGRGSRLGAESLRGHRHLQ